MELCKNTRRCLAQVAPALRAEVPELMRGSEVEPSAWGAASQTTR